MADKEKRRRTKLFTLQKGKCYYCKCYMVLMWSVPPTFKPNNLCTIEHIYDRNNGPRPEQGEWVAACHQCNHMLGRERHAKNNLRLLKESY